MLSVRVRNKQLSKCIPYLHQDLLDECLEQHSLDTAILYLVILQNLHPLQVSRNYIVKLLEASIEENRWDLGVDLLRFLHAISNESEKYPGVRQKKLTGPSELAIRYILVVKSLFDIFKSSLISVDEYYDFRV